MTQHYQHRDERVRQIAQATLDVIAESGLRAFTTRAIAERVGITDGTIFRHFKSKEDMVLAAMDLLEETMFADPWPDDPDPLVRLERFFRKRAALLGGDSPMGRLMFSEQLVYAAGEAGRDKLADWRARNMAFVTGCLRELAQARRLVSDRSPEELRVLIQGVLLTLSFERMLRSNASPTLERDLDERWLTLRTALVGVVDDFC